MTIEMPTLSKNKKSSFIPAWLFVCFFITLAAKPNDLKAEEHLLYFDKETSVLLYQDADVSSAVLGGYFPESISFSRDAQKMWIQFPEEEYGRIHLLGFAQTVETGQWIMKNAIYAYKGDTTASLICEDDIYYTVYSEIGNSADRQMIDVREEDMLLHSICIVDLEKMLYKLTLYH